MSVKERLSQDQAGKMDGRMDGKRFRSGVLVNGSVNKAMKEIKMW